MAKRDALSNLEEEMLFGNDEEINQEEEETMEMELVLDGEDLQEEIEEAVQEKVKEEEKKNKAQKRKRGPKPGSKAKKDSGEEAAKPKAKELDLGNINIVQREIKKGRLTAPQGRIEKTKDGYEIFISKGVIYPKDQNWQSEGNIKIMHEGKFVTTLKFEDLANENGKFNSVHENGMEVEHEFVRVELHKPGRLKDVVELYSISEAKSKMAQRIKLMKSKEEKVEEKA
jgi:hypothetical protein